MTAFNQIIKHIQTTLFIMVAVLLFVNSCPVKKGIQSQDSFKSQAAHKNAQNKIMSAKETCVIDTEIQYAAIGQTPSDWSNNLIPVLLFTAFFSGLFNLFFRKKTSTFPLAQSSWTSSLPLHVKHCVFII